MCIRLPVHEDDVFQWEASERGLTARALAAQILTEWLKERNKRAPAHHAPAAPGVTHAGAALADEFFR